jgi:hypothetical protein
LLNFSQLWNGVTRNFVKSGSVCIRFECLPKRNYVETFAVLEQ